ncbi:MAG: 4Fe-4S binding protein [[Clostridium] leptum]
MPCGGHQHGGKGRCTVKSTRKKRWSDYLWIAELCYLFLGLFNILFAWLGMLFFCIPLFVAIFGGSKAYCNRYCGRGQLFSLLGEKLKLSRNTPPPKFLRSPWFRYGFLTFFMVMFGLMLFSTYRVFTGAPLSQTVTLLWVFKLPWQWADVSFVAPGIGQFAFGFFGVMLTSTVLGLLTMVLFRPRSWCVYCPMGTMTQGICKLRNGKKAKEYGRTGKENSGAAEASGE